MNSGMRRNLVKGIDDDEIQIIGVEFTVDLPDGYRQELGMWSPQGLIIPRLRSASAHYAGYAEYRANITFHSTDGDFNITGFSAPW